MENQFFVDSPHLSLQALEQKHRLESDPSSRKSHMEYLPGMERISSDVCGNVMAQVNDFDASRYTAEDVRRLMDLVRETVLRETGVLLEPEVKLLGF